MLSCPVYSFLFIVYRHGDGYNSDSIVVGIIGKQHQCNCVTILMHNSGPGINNLFQHFDKWVYMYVCFRVWLFSFSSSPFTVILFMCFNDKTLKQLNFFFFFIFLPVQF